MSIRHLVTRANKEKVFFFYSLSSLVLQASMMIAALVSLRYVPPELMGIWQTLTLISTYGNILNLGIARGLSRELPFFFGRGEREKALAIAATSQFYILLIGLIGSIGFIAAAILYGPITGHILSMEWLAGLVGMGFFWFTSLYRSYLAVTFRAEAEFRRLAIWQYIQAGLNIGLLVLVVTNGYFGLILLYVLIGVITVVALHIIRPIHVKPSFRWSDFKILLQTGIPQYISSYLIVTSLSFDQTIILQRGSIENVGLYTPVSAISAIMLAVQASIVSYVSPQVTFRLGQHGDPRVVGRGVLVAVGVVAAVNMPIVLFGLIAMPMVISWLFPQYVSAIVPAQISLVGGFFLAMDVSLLGLYALKIWRYMGVYAVSSLVLRWMIPWLFTHNGNVLVNVAKGTALANILLVVVGLISVWLAIRNAKSLYHPSILLPIEKQS